MKIIINKSKLGLVKVALVSLPLLAMVSSCKKDFLNLPPELSLPEESSFETSSRIEAQINGLYGSLKNGNFYGGRYLIYNDIRAEEFLNRTNNGVTGLTTYQHTNDPSDTYIANFWNQGYLTINRANKFLADFDNAPAGVVSDQQEVAFRAEAKFVRALTYYSLVQLFAKPYALDNGQSRGLPLRLQAETSSANNELAPSTVAQIYDQILKDLNDAEAGLPDTYGTAKLRTTRAHKNTAIALKTRIYLAMGKYSDVITEANKIVSAGAPFVSPNRVANKLQADVVSAFRAPYTSDENILSFPMADTNAPGTQNQLGYYYNAGNIEYYLNKTAPGIFVNTTSWTATDKRRVSLTSAYSADWQMLIKWSAQSPYIDWIPVIRYAEVLLNLAEAEAEVGSQARALALLSAVHQRSDADFVFPAFAGKADLINAILIERRIELLGEGFRAPDIQRRLLPMVSVGAGADIPVTDDRYVFPIPTGEVQTNPGIK